MTSLSQHCDRILAHVTDPAAPFFRFDVVGDVGMGKTALLDTVGQRCSERGLLVLNAVAPRFDSAKDPELANLDACSALIADFKASIGMFQRQHPESEAATSAAMDSLARARNPSLLYHLAVNSTSTINVTHSTDSIMVGNMIVGNEQVLTPQELFTILQNATEEALRGLTKEHTLAILVDDVDRLDGTSVQDWLRALLRQLPTGCTVTARRPGSGSWRQDRTAADRTIELRNMSLEEVGAYLENQGLAFTDEDAHGLFDLTGGHGVAVATWCDLALNGGATRFADLVDLGREAVYDEGFISLVEPVQLAVDQIARQILGYQVQLFGLLTIAEAVTPGLIAVLEGDTGQKPSESEADKIYSLLARRRFISVVDRNVEEAVSLTRAISEVAWRRLRENDRVGFRRMHARAELYERERVDLDRELKPKEKDQEPFAAWTRFEQTTWVQGVERWLGHTQWLDREQFEDMKSALVKIYLDAFWWWDDYLRSKATRDLGTVLRKVAIHQQDELWMDALEKFSDYWVSSWDEAELRSNPAKWQSVMEAVTALLNMFNLEPGRIPRDLTLRRIYILLCNLYGKALWYAGNATMEDAEEVDQWLAAAFLACQRQPSDDEARLNPNGWIGSWALLRRAEIWAVLDRPRSIRYLAGLDRKAIDDEDDDLRVGVAMVIGDLWWRSGEFAQALEVYSRAILLTYAYNGKQEKRRKAPNLYTKSLYASTIRRTGEKISELVQAGDPEVLKVIDTALAAVKRLFQPYWDRVGGRPNPSAEPPRFELPVPPPWVGDILQINSEYFADLEFLVSRRQSVINEPIDPPPSGNADGERY
jgi:tetratricopeptide (TPR) repeat protein